LLLTLLTAFATFVAPADGGRVTATAQCPKAPDGFVVELVMQHPEVKWPSAVHCRADGSLLVAEDPMDMPGPTDQPLDRIWLLRFAPDGSFTKTLFAEHLFAVMGLQEIDDAVYVMNMPRLTVLRDRDGDGVAEERRELITNLGPPAPGWPGGFNDHIVSGLRLGMDGFLYVSVGDKGVPRASGTDGSEITLRGGGVVRVRPDGSQLEIVASGTRNHLDVCMNERDDIFTYDNTDDGLGWWTRFSHIMPTGYYGYPWDYHDHPERMLPCMRDDGGGSGVGGLVYREDAWPEEYRGDVFCCDWADRAIRRYKVARDGASYKCTLTEEFITPGESGEFRPLDIAESADGRYLYIADWNYPGWTNPTVAGRVWRVRRADDRPGAPWLALEEQSKESINGVGLREQAARMSDETLIANLDHPAFLRRLIAQRELARRGSRGSPDSSSSSGSTWNLTGARLADAAFGSPLSVRGHRHAIWALAAIPSPFAHPSIQSCLSLGDAETKAQAARAAGIGAWRDIELRPYVEPLLRDPDLMVRREAAIALGRLGDGAALWPLVQALDATDDLFVRFAIRQAIRVLPCQWDLLVQKFIPRLSPRAQEDVWLALREIHDVKLVVQLAGATTCAFYSPEQRARALSVLAEAHRKRAPWDGKWWSIQPAKSGWPLKTIEWEGTAVVAVTIEEAFRSNEPALRAAALAAVRSTREPYLFHCVREQLDSAIDPAERVALIVAVSELGDPQAAEQFRMALHHVDPRVRAAGVVALSKLIGDAANDDLARRSALEELEPRLADEDPSVRAAALEAFARRPDAKRLADYLGGLALGGTTRELCRQALAALRADVRPALEAMATRGELDPATLAVVREIYDDPLPLLRWKLFGPFARDARAASIEGGAQGGVPAGPLVEAALPHGFVDLKARVSDKNNVAAYALATLDSPIARTARCALGSDDGVTVWVNGAKAFDHKEDRAWAPDQDRFEIALVAGANQILLRVEQGGGDWAFNVKVSDVPTGPLFSATAAPPFDLATWRDFALKQTGDAARGKALFYAETGSACFRCHAVAGVGPKLGPDLRDVGTKYARAELVTSILEPSQRILDGYAATNVFLNDGDVLSGLVAGEKEGVLLLADGNGAVQEIRVSDVKEKRVSQLSAMPTGLAEKLSKQELADLVAWLETLKQ